MAQTATLSEPETIQQAFAQAKEQHSAPAERAPSGEISPESSETDEQSDDPQASDPTQSKADTTSTTDESSDLISDAEMQALRDKTGNDPEKLAKELKAHYTRKTQALAEQRKGVAELEEFRGFIADYKADAKAALARVAKQHGLDLVEPTAAKAEPAASVSQGTDAIVDQAVSQFRDALGPDLDFLADKLAPAVKGMAEAVAKAVVGQEVAPVKEHQQQLLTKAAQEQSEAVMKAFGEKYPDWQQHDKAMTALAAKIPPSPTVEPLEYLDLLYTIATKDVREAEATKKAVAKLTKAAEKSEPVTHPVAETQVQSRPPSNLSFRDAYDAAKRGERWE